MKTLSMIAIAMTTLVGVANAGDPAKAADPKAPAKAADPKAPATPAKAAEPAAKMPEPPKEVAEVGKLVSGTWNCTGNVSGMDGKSAKMTATMKTKVDDSKFWIVDDLAAKGPMNFKMQSFTTYDAAAKKWRRVSVDNMGTYMVGSSDGGKDKMEWNLDAQSPSGASQFRDKIDMSDAKAGVKMTGEMSMDKGKTWKPVYDMTCKK
jgi:uncharacterized protein DUF1579